MILVTLILKFFLGIVFLIYKILFAVIAGAVCLIMSIIANAIDGKRVSYHRYGKVSHKVEEPKKPLFSDEEILATGLYPKDEGYEMSLISRILDK